MTTFDRRNFLQLGVAGGTGLLLSGLGANSFADALPQTQTANILDFGAKSGGKELNTTAIQKAIESCFAKGGGHVVIPAGTFLSGSLTLKSNVSLYLEKDAVLLTSPYSKDFPERKPKHPARYEDSLKRTLIYAQGERNISVLGPGILDGNAKLDGSGEFQEKNPDNPTFIWFDDCENVLVKDITFRRSVWWTQAYSVCRHVHIDHISVTENYFYNADGCDIVDCEDFIVENCDINCDDDAICLKGFTNRGCNRGLIRNNKVRSLCNGIKMGTDSSGGFRNIAIENNEVWQTGISGLALQIVDGGMMENITVRNLAMNGVGTPITMRLGDRNRAVIGELTVEPGIMRNISISNVQATVNKAKKFNEEERTHHDYEPFTSSICGIPNNSIQDVLLENIAITILSGFPPATAEDALRTVPEVGGKYPENRMFGLLPSYGFYVRHAEGLRMSNVSVDVQQKDGRPAFLLDDVHRSEFRNITTHNLIPSPAFAIQQGCSDIRLA